MPIWAVAEKKGTDAECAVTLVVKNTDEREFRFEDKGRSLVAASFRRLWSKPPSILSIQKGPTFLCTERCAMRVTAAGQTS